jgi:hypothetical protein
VCDLCKTERKTEARDTSVFSFFRDEQKTKRPHTTKNNRETRIIKREKKRNVRETTNERTNGNGAKTVASALSPRAYNFWGGGPPLRAVEF